MLILRDKLLVAKAVTGWISFFMLASEEIDFHTLSCFSYFNIYITMTSYLNPNMFNLVVSGKLERSKL